MASEAESGVCKSPALNQGVSKSSFQSKIFNLKSRNLIFYAVFFQFRLVTRGA